jgi:ATP-dependent helicase/nuclease subunit B
MSHLRTLHVFRRLRGLALVLLRDILHELSHSAFRPIAFEESIGEGASVPYYEIELTDGHRILLGGKVDRVDCYRQGEDVYLRVIDYKTGTKEFSLKDVARGVNMQLLIYLFSLCRPEHTHPAGAMYVATDHGDAKPEANRSGLLLSDLTILAAMNDEWDKRYLAGISKTKKDEISGKAQISAEGLEQLESDICGTLETIGEDMIHGRAARTPSKDACRFCSMRAGCPVADHSKSSF